MTRALVRAALSVVATSTVLAAAWAPISGCFQAQCDAVCAPALEMNAHVPVSAAALSGASIKFCRNGACESGAFGPDAGTNTEVQLSAGPFSAEAEIWPEVDGGAGAVVQIWLDVFAQPHPTFTNGDIYSVNIASAEGTPLLGVSCQESYTVEAICGTTCQEGTIDVYPMSASGVACGK